MLLHSSEGIEWLTFDLFQDIKGFSHAVFLRHGGESKDPYCSLNSSFTVGDETQAVKRNLAAMEKMLSAPLFGCKQVHGKEVVEVSPHMESESIECDALMTAVQQLALMARHADCQAAIFLDPINMAFSVVHCGWRGNVQNVYRAAIDAMQNCYGSKPADLLVGISPSLGPNAAEFQNYKNELPELFWEHQVKPAHFDLWAIAENQLLKAGILPHHLEIARICTFTEERDWYSYRRQKVTGRHATAAYLHGSNG